MFNADKTLNAGCNLVLYCKGDIKVNQTIKEFKIYR